MSKAKVQEITFQELKSDLIDKKKPNFVLIDVRNPDELKSQGAIPGAVNIPLPEVVGAFKMNAQDFKAKYGFDKDTADCVFSCRSGMRAATAIDNLNGIVPIEHMKLYRGSFMDWEANKGPVKK